MSTQSEWLTAKEAASYLRIVKELNRFLADGGYVEGLPEHGGR
jgi:hypothetical protein